MEIIKKRKVRLYLIIVFVVAIILSLFWFFSSLFVNKIRIHLLNRPKADQVFVSVLEFRTRGPPPLTFFIIIGRY